MNKELELLWAAMKDHLQPFVDAGADPGPLGTEVIEDGEKVRVQFWFEFDRPKPKLPTR